MTERAYSGRLIVLEGSDGAGKTTQARLLADALIAAGRSVTLTREPGGSVSAEAVRGLLLSDLDWTRESEVLLYTVARIEHVERVIRPSLARGNVVVCDRFIDSTFAYQGAGFGAEAALLQQMAELAGIKPDVVIVLDTSPEVGLGRVLQRESGNNRYDRIDKAFRERVRQCFLDLASADVDRYAVIDGDLPQAEVHRKIMAVLARYEEIVDHKERMARLRPWVAARGGSTYVSGQLFRTWFNEQTGAALPGDLPLNEFVSRACEIAGV